jgi:2-keto-4-pentenoate hydratase/2-oxohepta-3-ene-1,7-dioic acid hydratase in catechol pathway
MRLCSYRINGRASFGAALPNGGIVDLRSRLPDTLSSLLAVVKSGAFEQARAAAKEATADHAEAELDFLPIFEEPVAIHCVGLNYALHTAEAGREQPPFPRTFIKVPAALVGHGEAYEMPTLSPMFDFEGELAVIIGRTAREVSEADALDYVAGYTCFMDGSVRDYQLDRTITQGKNFTRSSSMGPHLVTPDEVGDLAGLTLTTRVSGNVMQQTTFDQMIFPVPELISYVSQICQLNPGDVIATGTPEGVGFKRKPPRFLVPGDSVEVAIDRVGTLRNTVEPSPGT